MPVKSEDGLNTFLLSLLHIGCVVGMLSVPIAILYGLETGAPKRLVEVTRTIQTTEHVLDGHCDVTRTDGGMERVFNPVNGAPHGERVECVGQWFERPVTC